LSLLFSAVAFAQGDIVRSDGVTSPVHQANVGRITFMAKPIPIENYREADFLSSYELKESGDLGIGVFLRNSLTNYLHRLAPEMSATELAKNGNYQFSFFVDGALVYRENLHVGAGTEASKHTRTVFRVPLQSTTNEGSWGRFLWNRFLWSGGDDALGSGTHLLKIEIRPYLKNITLNVGDIIAAGQLQLIINKPPIDERLADIQVIQPQSGWQISNASYDKERIKALNRKIAERTFKEITSLIVIKDGRLLVEEYFNGANRETLHNTRSVGKSFASTMAGVAIAEGHIKGTDQTLKDFYDLSKFANYSSKKDGVTIKSLLTMSSAFLGTDFDEASPGNEEKMYPTSDWVKFALDLPMDDKKEIGKTWDYFTAGVVVLGDIIHRSVPGGLEKYAHEELFTPLGVTNYKWQYTPQGVANTAGGLQLSALDLAKYGQLYKNRGRWNGKQVIPDRWVDLTFSRHLPLPNSENEFYGYLFWNKTYNVDGKDYETFYATGNGGNKIFIFNDQPLVIVITATAYGKPYMHRQVDRMMEKYVLPAVTR
jgi:CubicO group peptidase (beta-lactamase class C family)